MYGKFFSTILALFFLYNVQAQQSGEVEKLTPEIPGDIVIDAGFNLSLNQTDTMNFHWFRSKSAAITFVKPFDVGNKFSFRPGIGVSLEKLGTKQNISIDYVEINDTTTVVGYTSIPGKTVKSQLAMNFIELPVEMRYNFAGNDAKGGFFISLGLTAGYRFEVKTKEKFETINGKFKVKRKNDYGIEKLRFGAHARIGVGKFNVFYKYYFTDVFNNAPHGMEELSYSTVGISVGGF